MGSKSPISDKDFFQFKWPKRMPSFQPKIKKTFKHFSIFVYKNDPEVDYVIEFTSEKKARANVRSNREGINIESVRYEKKEMPQIDERGYIE